MLFADTNCHLSTKPCNLYIHYHSNSESYDRQIYVGTNFGVGPFLFLFLFLDWMFFHEERLLQWLLGGHSHMLLGIVILSQFQVKIITTFIHTFCNRLFIQLGRCLVSLVKHIKCCIKSLILDKPHVLHPNLNVAKVHNFNLQGCAALNVFQ